MALSYPGNVQDQPEEKNNPNFPVNFLAPNYFYSLVWLVSDHFLYRNLNIEMVENFIKAHYKKKSQPR